jgi:hypothetical protein
VDWINTCSLCGASVELGSGYIVRIDVFADPEIPPLTAEQIAAANLDQTLAEVIEQARKMSEQELQESVHRRFEYRLCPSCHRRYLDNPLGMPRVVTEGKN